MIFLNISSAAFTVTTVDDFSKSKCLFALYCDSAVVVNAKNKFYPTITKSHIGDTASSFENLQYPAYFLKVENPIKCFPIGTTNTPLACLLYCPFAMLKVKQDRCEYPY